MQVGDILSNYSDFFQHLKAVNIAQQIMESGIKRNKVVLNYDPDVDGIVAGYIMETFLRKYYHFEPCVSINKNRGHGIVDMKMSPTSDMETKGGVQLIDIPKDYLILNVDSGVSADRLKELVGLGYDVVSLDHHELEFNATSPHNVPIHYEHVGHYGIVLNNQYEFEDPDYQFQSGSGVVLTYCQTLQPDFATTETVAFNALTLLSDSRDIDNDIARNFLRVLYNTTPDNAPHLYTLCNKIGFNKYTIGQNLIDRTFIDYTFSPYLNAAMRMNLGYETIKWINHLDIVLGDVRKYQREIIELFYSRMRKREYNNLIVIEIQAYNQDWFVASNFIGLFANKFLDTGKSVVIYSVRLGEFERGSFRGVYPSLDYKGILNKAGIVSLGHKAAFGIKNMVYSNEFWLKVDQIFGLIQKNHHSGQPIVKLRNLSTSRENLLNIARENMYHSSGTRTYIKYRGLHFGAVESRPKITTYNVDGLIVICFDNSLTPKSENAFIEPVYEKRNLKLYLKKLTI